MSDYGYRPAPPPEDGRPRGGGQQGGRAQGNPSGNAGSGQSDYGWGGGQPQSPQGRGGAPRPRPQQQPYGTPASGSASVGRASGSASVGRGSASVGRASGSASVGGASGAAPVGGPGRTGRASVGSASVGSASVGSASVGSASVTSARPGGREDRAGRAGSGPGGRRRAGKGPLGEADLDPDTGKKKRKRLGRKMFATFIALGVLLVGAVTVTGAYFIQSAPQLENVFRQGESSAFYYANGTTQAGAYGDTLRLQAEVGEIPETVTDALVSLEDRKFWDHGGVDYVRTMGALVNNVTGGETQGGSTITQQYAGMVLEAREEISYDRKAREAAMAMKMESEYSKDEIITAYLNMAYFGRGAYGIEAAAKNYFGVELKDVTYDQAAFMVMQVKSPNGYYDPYYTDAYDEGAAQGRWNFAMNSLVETGDLSQSERDEFAYPTPIDEFNSSGSWGGNTDVGFLINELDGYVFDELLDRYGITREMLKGGEDNPEGGGYTVTLTVDPEIQAALKSTGSRGDIAVETNEAGEPVDADGAVVDAAQAERILTDEGYAQFVNSNEDAALEKFPEYMMTAMVAIDPETGAVLGYYGGDNGFGVDKAGAESPHPPSSTFKMVTAATALESGDSTESWFNGSSPRQFDSLTLDDVEECIGGGDYPDCTLRNGSQNSQVEMTLTDAVRKSKNTPMYSIAEQYDASTILDLADQMGLSVMNQARTIEDDEGTPHDVSINYVMNDDGTYTQHGTAVDAEGNSVVDASGNWDIYADIQVDENCNPIVNLDGLFLAADEAVPCDIGGKNPTDPFYNHIAFGQYPTSVRDMASIYATIANNGFYNESHFVAEVKDNTGQVVEPFEGSLDSGQVISEETARNLQWIGSEISGESATGEELDRDYFGKTGTWEAGGKDKDGEDYPDSYNAHAWYVGAIPQLSIAAWVGNLTSESDPIADVDDDPNNVFGSNTAYPVWFTAMDRVLDKKDWDKEEWDGRVEDQGNVTSWDIENAGGPLEGGAFCAAKPDDALCAGVQDEQAQQECEADGGTWDGEACQEGEEDDDTEQPTSDPTDTPTDDSTDEECGGFMQPPCDEETPSEEGSTTPEDDEDNGG
ncbi:transglycosylase domain-containing protein [Glycomyces harbinensis]|uniref:Membrane carboxypeptidase (Penicillin-binding protein) n=1 Tax=Glycomyces harbinensis TaxID=58114 RepID=A0A1G6VUI9_9ACTN|nr:transglycosylase domain-containing protein [Glycomyces harbinensis]SDD57292.1 Membrane carboxypeptidase (penicillin-binding protein) [Glycomyces harbinensis]